MANRALTMTGLRGVLSCRFHPTAPLVGASFRPLCIHAPSLKKLTMLPPRARPVPLVMDLAGVVSRLPDDDSV
jgi:hypothetical protein